MNADATMATIDRLAASVSRALNGDQSVWPQRFKPCASRRPLCGRLGATGGRGFLDANASLEDCARPRDDGPIDHPPIDDASSAVAVRRDDAMRPGDL